MLGECFEASEASGHVLMAGCEIFHDLGDLTLCLDESSGWSGRGSCTSAGRFGCLNFNKGSM